MIYSTNPIIDSNCLLPNHEENCEFCGCAIDNDKVYIYTPNTKGLKEWQGWIEWRLDDGTSHCKFAGGEEV